MTKRKEYNSSASRVRGSLHERVEGEYRYFDGAVDTPDGIVRVYSQEGERPFSTFRFIHASREYTLQLNRAVTTSRGAAIEAGRWVREIMGELRGWAALDRRA